MKTKILSSDKGAVLVVVALFTVVLLAVTGLAIDSGIGYGVRAKLNAALDAAAIAAARAVASGENDGQRAAAAQAAGEKFFDANFPSGWLGATPAVPTITAVHKEDGYWEVNASGSASVPTSFMRILGRDIMTVNAAAQAIRRDLDMVLVIDCSGSLNSPPSPPGTFRQVKDAAKSFVARFNSGDGGDRLGLVTFASGAVVDVQIDRTAVRGFNKAIVVNAINALTVGGSTASSEAMRIALNEIESVPEDIRSSLRVIVFFSDGAPNDVPANFVTTSGQRTGDLYSETESGPAPRRLYWNDRRDDQRGTYTINNLPATGLGGIPLAGYNGLRTLFPASAPYSNTRCNVNKAARNMVENVANNARNKDVYVYTLGLGARLNDLEVNFCGYGSEEYGANILRRLANTDGRDGGEAADTLDDDQPAGLYVYAADADQLETAFNQIASDILRLTK